MNFKQMIWSKQGKENYTVKQLKDEVKYELEQTKVDCSRIDDSKRRIGSAA